MDPFFRFLCPSCGKRLKATPRDVGKKAECPCGCTLLVPAPSGASTGEEALDRPALRELWPWFAGGAAALVFTAGLIVLLVVLHNRPASPDQPSDSEVAATLPSGGDAPRGGKPPDRPAAREGEEPTEPETRVTPHPSVPESEPTPLNQPPTVEISRAEPLDPRVGETLRVELRGTDPDGDDLRYRYRTDPEGEWLTTSDGRIYLSELKMGALTLEVRAEDAKGLSSAVVQRTWTVKAPEPPPSMRGGVVELTKVPPVRTDNRNTLVTKYRKQFTLTASSTWGGWPTDNALDGNIESSWFSAQDDSAAMGRKPWIQATFPEDVPVARVTILGNRDPQWLKGYTILSGSITLYDKSGKVLKTETNEGIGNFRDFDFRFDPPVKGVRAVRFTSLKDQGNQTVHRDIGIAEVQIE